MSRFSDRSKVALAAVAALVIVAVPHLLTVQRGDSETVIPGDVHPCMPLPNAQTFRIFVRNVPCSEGTDLAEEILSSEVCAFGACTPGERGYRCNRSARAEGRLFWLCRTGGGEKVRFIIAGSQS